MLPETGNRQKFKRAVLDTVCIYVYRCGHVYVPSVVALDTLLYSPGQMIRLENTDCEECHARMEKALYTILANARRESDQARAEADGARNVRPTLLHGLPEEVARLRGTGQQAGARMDMSSVQPQ